MRKKPPGVPGAQFVKKLFRGVGRQPHKRGAGAQPPLKAPSPLGRGVGVGRPAVRSPRIFRGLCLCQISSSASAAICLRLCWLSADFRVTVVSVNVMFFDFSNMDFMTLAAIGAHEPFSIKPIVRFW